MAQNPLFIIDSSVLKDIFEGKDKKGSNKLMLQMKAIKDAGGKMFAVTPMSSFLRAIFLCDPKININKIQKTLSFLTLFPSSADFKNEKDVMDEVLKLANILSGGKHGG